MAEKIPVLVEISIPVGQEPGFALSRAADIQTAGFEVDHGYPPIRMRPAASQQHHLAAAREQSVLVRAMVEEDQIEALRRASGVLRVDRDGPVMFDELPQPHPRPCPRETIGTLADAARYIGGEGANRAGAGRPGNRGLARGGLGNDLNPWRAWQHGGH